MFDWAEPYLVWIKIGAICLAVVLSGALGFRLGMDHVEAGMLAQQEKLGEEAKAKQLVINQWATDFENLRRSGDEVALKLNQEIKNAKARLAYCNPGTGVHMSGDFVRLHDAALQTGSANSGELAGSSPGTADPEDVLGVEVENGRRWKVCRDQLNELLGVLK